MLPPVMNFVLIVFAVYLIWRFTKVALRGASISDKFTNASKTEKEYAKVQTFSKSHKNIDKKRKKVDEFINN